MKLRKKLIEVALPLEAINKAATKEKHIRVGHPSTLHLWWSRKPLAAGRAIIFAQLIDDPSAWPDLFPTEKAQEKERQRLFKIIEDLVLWENTTNERVLDAARQEIWQGWQRTCNENAEHPHAQELFDRKKLPAFHDPFAGGGSLPLEAQRLGLESYASDLNPVAVIINKAMIEIPPKFAGRPPVNPEARSQRDLIAREWKSAQGLAEDVRYYSRWMCDEANKRIGHLYPSIEITSDLVEDRSDLKPYVGEKLTVIAWLWARTVKSPNPAFADVDVPLASTFLLSTKPGKGAYVNPMIDGKEYRFIVRAGRPENWEATVNGTKLSRGANFRCLMSGIPISGDYIKAEGKAGRLGSRLMAIVAEGNKGRVYLTPTQEQIAAAASAHPIWKSETSLPDDPRNFWTVQYGLEKFGDLFTARQLVALNTFSDLVSEAANQVLSDARAAGLSTDSKSSVDQETGAEAYSRAIAVYLACTVSRSADFWSNLCNWANQPKNEIVAHLFGRQAIPMAWGFAEASPFSNSGGSFLNNASYVTRAMESLPGNAPGTAQQADAATNAALTNKIISTDPPYYDNISYADLSDYFYTWLRRSLQSYFPNLFNTMAVPKIEELVASPYRHGGEANAEKFFLAGMTEAMRNLSEKAHPAFPATMYYAFRQAETEDESGTTNTGWETFLGAVIQAGFAVTGTWPIRSERTQGLKEETNSLASSIVMVCRRIPPDARTATRREFTQALEAELAPALRHLQEGNIAPVDLAQAAIGPGMAVYTRYAKVLDAEGKALTVNQALALINEKLDTVLAEQEGDFDAATRWALAWFEQSGFSDGEFGVADVLARAKNTSVEGMVNARILVSKSGKVRLLRPDELREDWNPDTDTHLTEWEVVHQLIRALNSGGETRAAELAFKLGSHADPARELAYRLYVLCERKKRAQEALTYNALVQSWPEILRLASELETRRAEPQQATMFS